MIDIIPAAQRASRLLGAGLPEAQVKEFLSSYDACRAVFGIGATRTPAQLDSDSAITRDLCVQGWALLAKLPLKSARNPAEKAAGHALLHLLSDGSRRFFRQHIVTLYKDLTKDGAISLRVGDLVYQAAARLPGILPTQAEVDAEGELMQKDKDGLEINQGLFISQVMSNRETGYHLSRSMLRPMAESLQHLDEFVRNGKIDLGTVRIEVEGPTAYVYLHNERYLNSEDDTTVGPLEMAIDLVLLHPDVRMGVLRGSVVEHPKYKGKRVFCSGINLTRIYQGKQTYLSFLYRAFGMHAKLYRGILVTDEPDSLNAPQYEPEETQEKLWVAVVDTFAIGGGCQLLLVVDYVIAETKAYFSLPARKEGILPGSSNMRLQRYIGERIARQAIMFDKSFQADSAEGRLLANEVVEPEKIDQAVRDCVENAIGSGMVSAGGNRKAMRIQTESVEMFRSYMATYAYEQAFCSLSEQLIANLEKHWNAKERKL
ncbi:enoyl-CoA hydratase/isomerase family protein [Lacisediminimonas sp.]|uniref:enoyl-CoA hydratase/isomerase family protein n=1 Tax=Lacisediminimonas sp. TaxID=3060582 RepID=UPI0027182CF1|nr:enoyl-CoA hydratase/isomerase family protein [Lacisediminimonas sp.]MDO8298201.1 enoyl-CoA hydratase/isomerase family protein [Lacisediminimonas sp.]